MLSEDIGSTICWFRDFHFNCEGYDDIYSTIEFIVYLFDSCKFATAVKPFGSYFVIVDLFATTHCQFNLFRIVKDNSWKAWSAGIFPTMSMIFYAAFAYITSSNGQWAQFSQLNTVSDDVMSVEVASNLLAPSQILFVAVVYYGVAIATYFIQQTSRQKEKGVTYA